MSLDRRQRYLKKILNHPGVEGRRVTEAKYIIKYKGRSWFLWPKSERYQFVENGHATSALYFEEVNVFYHRYITETLDLPGNSGKQWTQAEKDIFYEMIALGSTINQIAAELERHPMAIASRVAKHLDHPRLARCNGNQLDIGIDELVELLPTEEDPTYDGNYPENFGTTWIPEK